MRAERTLSNLSALCFCVCCVCACLCISVCIKTSISSPMWAALEGTVWLKTKACATIYLGVSPPCKWEQLSRANHGFHGYPEYLGWIRSVCQGYCRLWGMMCERSTSCGPSCSPSCLKTRREDNMALFWSSWTARYKAVVVVFHCLLSLC